jgi:hypothetical protein
MSTDPCRRDENRTQRPSGEKDGFESNFASGTSIRSFVPSAFAMLTLATWAIRVSSQDFCFGVDTGLAALRMRA